VTAPSTIALASDTLAAEQGCLHPPRRWLIPLLAGFLVLVMLTGLAVGAMTITPGSLLSILASTAGIELPWSFSEQEAVVLLHIRAPRVVLGAVTGAALALGGVLMQALFRNPLADPGLIGVSSGAAMAAAFMTVLGPAFLPAFGISVYAAMPVAAFLGGWLMAVLAVGLARRFGQTRIEHVLLAGIAINALSGSAIGLLMLVANDAQLREVAFWSFGSLGRATWPVIPVLLLLTLPILMLARPFAPWLNALLLGEGEATLLGVPVEQLKRGAILFTCLAVGGSVAFTGLIGFVGLVVPHVVRLITGPDHRVLIPASALLGAALLPLADLLARTVAAPVELPIGLVTALLGAPFFLALLKRDHNREMR
jgi:iron complex transport system permease protein